MRAPATSEAFGAWRTIPRLENDFFIDREKQKNETYSGISEFWAQDAGPQLSMGRVVNRNVEHLGTSDLGIISMRRRLLGTLRDLREKGITPRGVEDPSVFGVRSAAVLIPSEQSWFDATREHRQARPGVNLNAV
jgi:hypothetical protein